MKALTIKQPWADAIAFGRKRVENRTWNCHHRGTIALHAGLSVDHAGTAVVVDIEGRDYNAGVHPLGTLGAVIATARLRDVHRATRTCCAWDPYAERPSRAHPEVYHWILFAPQVLAQPVPARGMQGLWQVPDHLAEDITRQLQGARR